MRFKQVLQKILCPKNMNGCPIYDREKACKLVKCSKLKA